MRSRSILRLSALLVALTLLTSCTKKKKDGSSLLAQLADSGAATAKAASVDTITFVKKDPVVGSSFAETAATEMAIEITAPRKLSSTSKEQIASRVTILGADAKTIVKAKIVYSEHSKSESENGKAKSEVSPVAGKTYLVEFKDKKLVVTDENRKKVTAKEEKVVRGDADDVVGKPDPLLTEIPGGPMKVGDKADSLSEALRDLLSGDDKVEFAETSVRLKEISLVGAEKVGTFDVKTKVTIAAAVKIVIDLAGTMAVRESDSKLTAISLTGPLSIASGPVKAGGLVTATQTRTY